MFNHHFFSFQPLSKSISQQFLESLFSRVLSVACRELLEQYIAPPFPVFALQKTRSILLLAPTWHAITGMPLLLVFQQFPQRQPIMNVFDHKYFLVVTILYGNAVWCSVKQIVLRIPFLSFTNLFLDVRVGPNFSHVCLILTINGFPGRMWDDSTAFYHVNSACWMFGFRTVLSCQFISLNIELSWQWQRPERNVIILMSFHTSQKPTRMNSSDCQQWCLLSKICPSKILSHIFVQDNKWFRASQCVQCSR